MIGDLVSRDSNLNRRVPDLCLSVEFCNRTHICCTSAGNTSASKGMGVVVDLVTVYRCCIKLKIREQMLLRTAVIDAENNADMSVAWIHSTIFAIDYGIWGSDILIKA